MAGRLPLTEWAPCDRAREWVSLRLDDELSPLEEELLARHLEICEDCRAFESNVRWATDVMRMTTAERPSRRVTIPARPAGARWAGPRRAAAAAATALALGALVGSTAQGPPSTNTGPPRQVSLVDTDDFPRSNVPAPAPSPPPSPNPPEGVI
jgi:ferric-dicitrate binding protein FerR (iron transport regulator)